MFTCHKLLYTHDFKKLCSVLTSLLQVLTQSADYLDVLYCCVYAADTGMAVASKRKNRKTALESSYSTSNEDMRCFGYSNSSAEENSDTEG
jgi:hypothetical protein